MMMPLLIALVAGAASALMFASIVSGALISLVLFYLAPLPLMVAALGWGATGAVLGGLVAGAGLGLLFGFSYFIAFLVTIAVPAAWLGYLALLGRPIDPPPSSGNGATAPVPAMEWYPVGRVLAWTAGFAAVTTMAALFTLGSDAATITAALKAGLLRVMGARDGTAGADAERLVDALVTVAPGAAAVVAMMTLTLNLFLAAKITAMSGRLQRPWPDMKSTTLPPMMLAALSLGIGLSFAGGLLTMIGQSITASLVMAYALMGFAVLHTLTLAVAHRPFWLISAYAIVMVFGWPVLMLVGLGLADALFALRRRYYHRRATPPPLDT